MDEVARAVGRDPVDVRMENMVTSAQMPYTTIANLKFDNGDYPAAVRLCAEAIDLAGGARAPAAGRARRPAHRRGLCLLFRADRPRLRRMGQPRQPVHSRLRELHREPDAGRNAGAAGRHPVAWPGPGDDAVADRAPGARHRSRQDLGPPRRHRGVAVRHGHHRFAQHRHGRRRGRRNHPAAARKNPEDRRASVAMRRSRRALRRRQGGRQAAAPSASRRWPASPICAWRRCRRASSPCSASPRPISPASTPGSIPTPPMPRWSPSIRRPA